MRNRLSIHGRENDMQEIGENAQIETKSEGQTLRSRIVVEYLQSLLATLLAATALSLLGLFFFVVRVTSVFSGGRRIRKSSTPQMT